jgi:hypothetical protein
MTVARQTRSGGQNLRTTLESTSHAGSSARNANVSPPPKVACSNQRHSRVITTFASIAASSVPPAGFSATTPFARSVRSSLNAPETSPMHYSCRYCARELHIYFLEPSCQAPQGSLDRDKRSTEPGLTTVAGRLMARAGLPRHVYVP